MKLHAVSEVFVKKCTVSMEIHNEMVNALEAAFSKQVCNTTLELNVVARALVIPAVDSEKCNVRYL